MYAKGYKMTDNLVSAFSKAYNLNPTKADVLAYMADEVSLDPNDIHKEPLTKLKQDTIIQMQEGGVL